VLVEATLQDRPAIELIPGIVELRFTTNPGGAFGIFGELSWLFVAISAVVVGAIVFASRDLPSTASAVGLGLVLGGAVGNVTDRMLRGPALGGEVVDFIDLQVWPVFNLADTGIVIGAAVLLLTGLRRDRREAAAEP